jgi:antitoxin component of MazEF toxin-antitoxin module
MGTWDKPNSRRCKTKIITVIANEPVVRRAARPLRELHELLAHARPDKRHEEVDFGDATGREIF